MNKNRISRRSNFAFSLNSSPFSLGIMISADHEVDLAGIVLQNSDRLSAVLRRKYGVAAFLQTHGNQSEQGWLVLDHEHRFGAGEDLGLHRWRVIFYLYLQFGDCRRRQVNAEPGALSQGALNGDAPPALPYDAVNRRQPQSRPFALLFGGKEGLEDSGLGWLIYARAVVAHRQHHVVSGLHLDVATGVFLIQFHVGRFNHHFAALRHRPRSYAAWVTPRQILCTGGVWFAE